LTPFSFIKKKTGSHEPVSIFNLVRFWETPLEYTKYFISKYPSGELAFSLTQAIFYKMKHR